MKLSTFYLTLFTLILVLGIAACKNLENNKQMKKVINNLEEISCKFGDASLPPPYHRSYSIVANKDTVVLTIDSYDNILAQKSYPMPKDGLEKIAQSMFDHKISIREEQNENEGCTGGTTRNITFSTNKKKDAFSASAYYCGGKKSGTLIGDVDLFFDEMKAFTPDFKQVLDATRQ